MPARCRPFVVLALLGLVPGGARATDGSLNFILHKQINVYAGTNDVWGYTSPGGVELAIYGHKNGTSFVDATDPPNAVEIFHVPGPTSIWRDIKTYQHYAYIVTEGAGAGTGMQIVDLSDPLDPVHVGTYTGAGFTTAHNLWIDTDAGVAYMCGAGTENVTYIVSLADPENPSHLTVFDTYSMHDLYVKDGTAWTARFGIGLGVLDVTDPSDPVQVTTRTYAGSATHNTWLNDAGTHCITTDEVAYGHVKVWDVTNLGAITLESEWEVPSAVVHNALMKDDLIYISYYAHGTHVVDLTDPTRPVQVGFYDTSERDGTGFQGNWGVYHLRGDGIVYSSDRQEGLLILEFTGGYAGEIAGTVTNGQGDPVEGAMVRVGGVEFVTEPDGGWGDFVSGGTYDVVVSKFGYAPDTTTVVVPEHGAVVHDVQLVQLPTGDVTVRLSIAEEASVVVPGAVVEILDTPLPSLVTDPNGEVLLDDVPSQPLTLHIGRFGYSPQEIVVVAPAGGATVVDVALVRGFFDDADHDQAWIFEAPDDDATGGRWERGIPVGSTYGGPVAPAEDASETGEGRAFVTEVNPEAAFAGAADVDDGKTSLLTPVFDAQGLGDLTLRYQRWFSNRAPTQGDDEFRADVSTDGGSTWTNLETLALGTDAWAEVTVELGSLVTPSAQMQIRFVAEDLGEDQFVEAAIDDIAVLTAATGVGDLRTSGPLRLAPPSPNPFRSSSELRFELPRPGPVAVEVYDVSGRRIAELLRGERVAAGRHHVRWDGRDAAGRSVAAGVYFVRVTTSEGTRARKLTRVR